MNKNEWNSILLRVVIILLGITVFNKKESIENANLNKSKKTITKACHIRFANKFQQQNQKQQLQQKLITVETCICICMHICVRLKVITILDIVKHSNASNCN